MCFSIDLFFFNIIGWLLNQSLLCSFVQNSWTPLLIATKGGHADVVHSILQYDPNVNATDKVGRISIFFISLLFFTENFEIGINSYILQ
jgi:hypothetical protein